MNIVYLNGSYLPIEEAKISPLDRGFLFGDGVYEVLPNYAGRTVGFRGHIDRMNNALSEIGIEFDGEHAYWSKVVKNLTEKNGGGNIGIYLHVSRGAEKTRSHAFPVNVTPTVFGLAFPIPNPIEPCIESEKGFALHLSKDLRWKRCHIKSTALLGNVLHFQQGVESGRDETILYNSRGELTEGAMSNVFIVKGGVVSTPVQDNQILPGITRRLAIDILKNKADITVMERNISIEEVKNADEIWTTNSVDGIAPATSLDGRPVGDGKPGKVWEKAQQLYISHQFDY